MNEENSHPTPKDDPGKSSSPAPSSTAGGGAGGKTGVMKIVSGIRSAFRFGQGETDGADAQTGDVATRLAHQRTDLAIDRSYLAADRTLMAWIRTALSMISFGFTIGKLGQVMGSVEVKGALGHTRMMSVESIAYFLVVLGTGALLMAAIQHRIRMRELYGMGLRRQISLSFWVALVLIAVGGFALSSLVMAL